MCLESPSQLGDSGWSVATACAGPVAPPRSSTGSTYSAPSLTKAIRKPSGDHTGPVSWRLPAECPGWITDEDAPLVFDENTRIWFSPSRYRLEYENRLPTAIEVLSADQVGR